MPPRPSQRELFVRRGPQAPNPSTSPAGPRTTAYAVPPGLAMVRALARHGWLLLPIFALALGAAWAFCHFMPARYRATAQLEAVVDAAPIAGASPTDLDPSALESFALDLATPSRIATALGTTDAGATQRATRRLSIQAVPHSRTLVLSYQAASPAAAIAFLERLLASEWNDNATRQRAAQTARVEFLAGRAEQARTAAAAAGTAVWDLARRHGFADPAAQLQLATSRWQQLASEETSADIAGLDQSDTLAAHAGPVAPSSADATAVIGSPVDLEVQRAQAAAEVARLAAQYRPQAAPLVEARQRLASLEASLASLQQQAREARQHSLAAAHAKAQDLAAAVERQARSQAGLERFLATWNLAQRALQADQTVYSNLLDQLQQATAVSGAVTVPARVSQPPQADPEPVSPSLPAALASAFVLAALAAVGILALAERHHDRIRPAEAAELGAPVLGLLPRDALAPEFFSAIATAASALLTAGRDGAPTVAVVTAATPGEGKTTVATALARQLAAVSPAGVLLLDAHRQRPALHHSYEGALTPGVAELLRAESTAEAAMRRARIGDPASRLFYLAAGRSSEDEAPGPAVRVASSPAAELIAAARARFDWTIIDAGDVLAAPDPALWAGLADLVLVVACVHRTSRRRLRLAIDHLERATLAPVSVLLNQARARDCRRWQQPWLAARATDSSRVLSLQQRAS